MRSDSLSNHKDITDKQFYDLRKYPVVIENFIRSKGLENQLSAELGYLKIRNMFESIAKKRLENLKSDMKTVRKMLKEHPDLKQYLVRREKKVIKVYSVSPVIGYLNILRYMKQGKL